MSQGIGIELACSFIFISLTNSSPTTQPIMGKLSGSLSFWRKFIFAQSWAKKGKMEHLLFLLEKCFYWFIENCFWWLKAVWKENYYNTSYPIPTFMSCQILGIKLSLKLLLTDQIVQDSWKFNMSRMTRGMKLGFYKLCNKSSGLSLTWLGIPRLIQSYASWVYWKDKYGQVSFVYLISVNRGSYELTVVCLSLTVSVGHFNIFPSSY